MLPGKAIPLGSRKAGALLSLLSFGNWSYHYSWGRVAPMKNERKNAMF
jgi:hypothetical protein